MANSPEAARLAQLVLVVVVVGVALVVSRPLASANQLKLTSVPVRAPQRFSDALLPDSQRTGQLVENLGQVMLLNTYSSPKSIDTMLTKFNIFNRRKSMKGLKFRPRTFCTLGEFNRTHGPYEYNLDLMLQSSFNIDSKTIVMVPGYLSEAEEPWIVAARESWLQLDEDVNVIEVSWSDSNKCLYSKAVAHTPLVARQITIFLYYLAELSQRRLHDDDFLDGLHLIGHSLGAHIVGFVGQDLDGRAGRITGLDPAGPSFDQFPDRQRLSRHDAKLVEVLHTNSGKMHYINAVAASPLQAIGMLPGIKTMARALSDCYSGEGDTAWYGIDADLGHVDYYANNGRVQPGCNGLLHVCDHNRATDIYVAMLRYELSLRKSSGAAGEQRQAGPPVSSRLLAFKAHDYDHFVGGGTFSENCPAINSLEAHLGPEVSQTIRQCSLPMDLVTRASERIEELRENHSVDFLYSSASKASYYFRTLEDGNLVGDHYLLKVYTSLRDKSAPGAALRVRLEMPRGELIELQLDNAFASSSSLPIVVPFVHPGGAAARVQLEKVLAELNWRRANASTTGADQRPTVSTCSIGDNQLLGDLLPRNIKLQLARPKSKSVLGTVKDYIIKSLKSDDIKSCSLRVDLIEVHPVTWLERNFAGLYYAGNADSRLNTITADKLEEIRNEGLGIGCLTSETEIKVGLKSAAMGLDN